MASPNVYVYEYLKNGADVDMNIDGSTPITFSYVVPAGRVFEFSRINFILVDGSINPGDFGGISSGLSNGCLLQVVDNNGGVRQHFGTDDVPLTTNADFAPLAGVDIPISELAGDDQLPIRFTVAKAGDEMSLKAGDEIRFIIQDDLQAITKFRAMVQGILR